MIFFRRLRHPPPQPQAPQPQAPQQVSSFHPLADQRAFWRELGKERIRSSIVPINEAAKQIISAATLLQALYLGIITFSRLRETIHFTLDLLIIYISPVAFLLLSLIFSLLVLLPRYQQLNIASSQACEQIYYIEIERKSRYLDCAAFFLVISIILLFAAILFSFSYPIPSPPHH